jgi:hypothetical protein
MEDSAIEHSESTSSNVGVPVSSDRLIATGSWFVTTISRVSRPCSRESASSDVETPLGGLEVGPVAEMSAPDEANESTA